MKNPLLLPQQLKPDHLVRFRTRYGLTITDMKHILGHKCVSTWSRWEAGTVSIPLWLSWALIAVSNKLKQLEEVIK